VYTKLGYVNKRRQGKLYNTVVVVVFLATFTSIWHNLTAIFMLKAPGANPTMSHVTTPAL
jgi:hypothetical protein